MGDTQFKGLTFQVSTVCVHITVHFGLISKCADVDTSTQPTRIVYKDKLNEFSVIVSSMQPTQLNMDAANTKLEYIAL